MVSDWFVYRKGVESNDDYFMTKPKEEGRRKAGGCLCVVCFMTKSYDQML